MASHTHVPGSGRSSPGAEDSAAVPEELRAELEQLGVSPYEARVLLALVRLGQATAADLARVSGVPRTSTYQVLEGLAGRRLAESIPGDWPAVWVSPGRDEVLDRLHAAEQERLRHHRERTERLRRLMAETFDEAPAALGAYVHMLKGPAQMKRAYEQLVSAAEGELLMFTRPPYAWVLGKPNPAVMAMLDRGVEARVLYQADKWVEPSADAFRQEMQAYHQAGVRARLSEDLPVKLVVVDRQVVLVGMNHPDSPEGEYPVAMHIEHPGYARVQAAAFEQLWATAQPLPSSQGGAESAGQGRGSGRQ